MIFRLVAEFFLQNIHNDEILRHSLARRTALRNDVKAGFIDVDYVEKRRHSLGIDVIFNVKFGEFPLGFGKFVMS